MVRYGVYVFYDKDQIADEYNFYFLEALKKEIDKLIVICNGGVSEQGKKRFEDIADEVILRENEGYDITAYNIGLKKINYNVDGKYDEIVICNSTMFGPLYSFDEMFGTMQKKDLDFWGITNFHEVPFDPFGTVEYGYLPKHVQSFFMVFRKSLTQKKDFSDYWKNMPQIDSYEKAIGYHEAIFTKKFADMGYKWDVYVNTDDLEGYTYDPLRDFPDIMIEQRRCPVIKKRSFFHEYGEAVSRSGGEAMKEVMQYVIDKTDYDVNMIWTNIIRLQNMADVKKRLHLNYVLSTRKSALLTEPKSKIATIIHVYYDELAVMCAQYASQLPGYVDIYVTVPNEDKLKTVKEAFSVISDRKIEFRIVGNRGRDVAPFLVGCKDLIDKYGLICKVHDKKVYQIKPMSIGESWNNMCFDNMLKNKNYIENIINLFNRNEKLGMLMPPIPVHGPYYPTTGKGEWGENFPDAQMLADRLGLKCDMVISKEPVAPLGSMFWFRTDALKGLFEEDWQYEDFPQEPIADDHTILHAIERIYPFCVQDRGYYCGWVMADTYARIQLTNWRYMNDGLTRAAMKLKGVNKFRELVESIKNV